MELFLSDDVDCVGIDDNFGTDSEHVFGIVERDEPVHSRTSFDGFSNP